MWSPSRLAKKRIAKRRGATGAIINATPFAGIMIVLLFVMMGDYMVPHHPRGVPVDLPMAAYAAAVPKAQRDDAIRVAVTRDGGVFLGHTKVSLGDLPEQIRAALKEGAEPKVYLAGDARTKYGDIQSVVAKIQEAGITNVVILAEKSSPR